MKDETFRPNRVLSYFQEEWKILFFVTVSGLIYNLGLLAGPWFEGKMTGKLVDLLGGTGTFHQMLMLVTAYVVSIGIVQVSRYFKRFYVRRFANNVNRHMKQILYGTLVILIVLFIPGGILSILEGRYERIVSYFKNKKKSSVAGG